MPNLVKPVPGRNVLECCSGLQPSEKELLERRPGAFHHKNTPAQKYIFGAGEGFSL
jgi:hypothetical protein